MMRKAIVVAAAAVGLSSCGTTFGQSQVKLLGDHSSKSEGVVALVQPSSVRSAYYFNGQICPEPPPDTALQAAAQAAAKVSTPSSVGVDASGGLTTTVVQLAGRDHMVLVARDLLSSICIMGMNDNLKDGEAQADFNRAADVVVALAKAQQSSADADAKNATANLVKVAVAARATGDPAIIALINEMSHQVRSDADIVADRFTRADGSIITSEFTAFQENKDVKSLLGGAIANLAKIKSRDDLYDFVLKFPDSSANLASLAQKFNGDGK